ncbi:epoxide hydrolase, partial [Lentzea aerocolonigenes]
HQFQSLVDAGYHVVAPDQRGYGHTDSAESMEQYSILHLVGDVAQLIHALGEEQAVVIGHDWGAVVAWYTALLRPDLVRGVAGLSVPPAPRSPAPPLSLLRQHFGEGFYQIYFQRPGVAEAEFEADVRTMFRTLLGGTTDRPGVPAGAGFLDQFTAPQVLPDWLDDEDIDVAVDSFTRSGFSGGLNWYRNIDRNWELTSPWHHAQITPPALYLSGERDLVRQFTDISGIDRIVPNLRGIVDIPDAGHWLPQERPDEVNTALLNFIKEI